MNSLDPKGATVYSMIVGIPKEIKDNENRAGITPAGTFTLISAGHRVLVEKGAGEGSGFSDEEYEKMGAETVPTPQEVYERSEMILKVKEPLECEYDFLREDQILFTYLHLANEPVLTQELVTRKVVAVAYETVQLPNGSLPLLTPMSEVAGRMAVQVGAWLCQKPNGGCGVLLGGVPGVAPAKVAIIGGGIVGTNSAKMAVGLGAQVTVLDVSVDRLRYLDDIFRGRLTVAMSHPFNLAEAAAEADLLIGAVLIPGARTPKLVTEDMVKSMKPRSVIVDVAIDQGGLVETIKAPTTHAHPTFEKHGVIHYAVSNIPGAVPRTSTIALTNVTIKYALAIANMGWKRAAREDPSLAKGVNVAEGHIVCKAVGEAHGLTYHAPESLERAI